MVPSSLTARVCAQQDRSRRHGYHALFSVCVPTCLLLTIPGLVHGSCGRCGRRVALAGRAGHPPVRLKGTLHFIRKKASNANFWDPLQDDNCAMEHYPASSTVGVARMVAEWLSLDDRLIFQSVSQIISFQLEMELGRRVWDSREAQAPFLKADVHKSLLELI